MSASNSRSDTGPKVLRIGIVQRGKIIDERELKRRETVSVGTDESATFTAVSDAMPQKFDLFEYDGKNYYLRFEPKMEGRIQLDGQKVADFNRLRQMGRVVNRSGAEAVALSDSSRGKVVVGDVTVLFQFKAPAAAPVRPVLPADIRGTLLQNIDLQFAIIFMIVASVHVSVVAYARTLPYTERLDSIEKVSERFQKIIAPKLRTRKQPRKPKPVLDDAATEKEAKKATKKKTTKKKKTKSRAEKEASAKARRDKVKEQVAGKGLLKVLGAKGGKRSGGALDDVFSEGTGAIGNLGEAFDGIQAIDVAGSGTAQGTRGGGSGQGVGIGDLETQGGGRNVQAGVKQEARVSGDARVEAPQVDGELSERAISRVLQRSKRALQACYERALKRDPGLRGKVVIHLEVMETGRVTNIDIEDEMGSPEVVSCIRKRIRTLRFPRPAGGSVFVDFPVVFQPSN